MFSKCVLFAEVYHLVYGPVYTFFFLKRGVTALPVVLFDYMVTAQFLYFPAYYLLQEHEMLGNASK